MKSRHSFLFLCALIITSAHLYSEKITYISKTIIYDNVEKTTLLCDSIQIQADGFSLSGDTVLIAKKDKMLYGKGNVKLKLDEFDISGDSISFNYDTKTGSIYHAKTKIDKGFLNGERITTLKKDEYFIYNGHFTTCSADTPHYSFYASKMHLYQNDRVIVRPFVMFVKNVPVMAVPFFVLPVATTRKSGFLMPKAGYSSTDGKYLKELSYFYATNDFSDMTFSVDLFEKKGIIGRYEANVLVKPILSAALNAEYINELSGGKRWNLQGDYSHTLPATVYLKSRWDIASDIASQTDYTDTIAVVLKRNAESFLSLSKDFNFYSSYFAVSRNENFATNSISMKLPSYNGYLKKITFLKINYVIPSGINFYHSHSIDNSYYADSISDTNSISAGLNNRLETSYKLFKYFNLFPSFSINNAINSNTNISSWNASGSLSMNTQLYGVSTFGIFFFEKFRHTFIPDISFSRGKNYFMPFGEFTAIDSAKSNSQMKYSITNIIEAKRKETKDILLKNSFTVTYDIETDSFSSIGANLSIIPDKPVNFSLNASKNPYTADYKIAYAINSNLNIFNPLSDKKINLSLSNSTEKNDSAVISDRLNGSLSLELGENLSFSMSMLYDIMNRDLISTSISMNRLIHCWKASFRVSTYSSTFKYDFQISLVDIPEVSLDKGIFGPLLP